MKRKLVILLSSLVLLSMMVLLWQFTAVVSITKRADDTRLAVWMSVSWSMEAHTDEQVQSLSDELTALSVDDAYVYVSYLRSGDTFNPTYDYANDFLNAMRELDSDVRWFAWIGVPISIHQPDGTWIANRLEDAGIRQQIADFALFTVSELGFDGVHLNAELIPNDDSAFLDTLALIRETLPDDVPLSTTAHALRLSQPITSIPYPTIAHHWSPDYLRNVAQEVDQVVLMAYDSGLLFPRDYQSWMTYQTETSALALQDTETEFIIGLPISEEWTPSHQTQAETLAHALTGLSSGWDNRINGIALYPYWELDINERDVLGEFLSPR